jgi:hypothetical protein
MSPGLLIFRLWVGSGRDLMEVDIEYRIVDPSKPVGLLGGVLTYTIDGDRHTSAVHPLALVIDGAPAGTPPPRDLCTPIIETPRTASFASSGFNSPASSSGRVLSPVS